MALMVLQRYIEVLQHIYLIK